jgi:molecular chaperone HtpG
VFVSENIKDVLPDYLTVLKGCMDSTDIPLNVSRSYLQMDKNVRSLSSHISKKVTSCLQENFNQDRSLFESNFSDIEMVIKLGLLQDEKLFERCENFLLIKTIDKGFKTLDEAKGIEEKPTLYYVQDEHQSKNLLELFKEKNIPIYLFNSPLDSALLNLLESKKGIKFERVDGKLPESLVEKSSFDLEMIKPYFEGIDVSLQKFSSRKIPGMFVIDENMRRFKEYLKLSRQESLNQFKDNHPLVLNENNPLVEKLFALKDPEACKNFASYIKDLIALSQNLLSHEELNSFIERSSLVFEPQAATEQSAVSN